MACPPATQNIRLNIVNRQRCIDVAKYGPPNPGLPNEAYWASLGRVWGVTGDEAKTMRCATCAFFDVKKATIECIAAGIGSEGIDPYDSIRAGGLGYCRAFQFKCASARTCTAWVTGGPIR